MEIGFDNKKYVKIQSAKIKERIDMFDKLYLEIGGKLFDDTHAERVLPGFDLNAKVKMFQELKDDLEIILCINANSISQNKRREEYNISYSSEVLRLIDNLRKLGFTINSVVVTLFDNQNGVDKFIKKLELNKVKAYIHRPTKGYPADVDTIVSDEGYGANPYIKTTKKLILVNAPGPGSGKLATCLSQLYHEHKMGVNAGYAKYETFPVWNLPLNHPVNLAYEAATVDLADVNMIDPYHLEKYSLTVVNYNRDIEVFPLLKNIFEHIYGESPYFSPTDMGVNKVGFAIDDDAKVREASNQEIVRRYYQTKKNVYLGRFNESTLEKIDMLLNKAGLTVDSRKCVAAAIKKAEKTGEPTVALELPNGKLMTGHRGDLLGACAALLIKTMKYLARIDEDMYLLMPVMIEPMKELKMKYLHRSNARLRAEEVLLALSIQSKTNPLAELALNQLPKLKNCEAHSSTILSEVDLGTLNRLGIRVTEEPISYKKKLYTKNQ